MKFFDHRLGGSVREMSILMEDGQILGFEEGTASQLHGPLDQ